MIKEEFLTTGPWVRHYSDQGVKIKQNETGAIYDDAIDVIPCPYTYSETDIPIAPDPEDLQNETE